MLRLAVLHRVTPASVVRQARWWRSLVEKPLDELRERAWILKAGIRIEAHETLETSKTLAPQRNLFA